MQDDSVEGGRWISLSVWTPPSVQDGLINFLVEQTGRGLKLEKEWITAYCQGSTEALDCLKHLNRYYQDLQQLYPELPELKVVQEDLPDEDWSESWKTFFEPLTIGNNIVVTPSWKPFRPIPGQVVIEIDPGRAFGTGKHPSTALCIEALEGILTTSVIKEMGSGLSVLDLGTGSGILGIVAAKLGAKKVLGLDIDSEALEVAKGNLTRNGVEETMTVSDTPVDGLEETYHVVIANLTASLLTQMATSLTNRVAEKGMLLLSGILAEQVEEVVKCFRAHYFTTVKSWTRKEWQAILLRREEA